MNRLTTEKIYFPQRWISFVVILLSLTMLNCYNAIGQSMTYSTTVNSTSGQNYAVNIEIELTTIIPVQNTCAWGYNYDVAYNYNIQIVGSNTSLYALAGYLTCGANQGIYFDLPNNGGSGSNVTQGNPWNNNSDCATATVESLMCNTIELQVEGEGIPNQTITLSPASDNNGGGQDWCTNGNNADSTSFIGTINSNPLVIRTNNEERMRITADGNIGVGVANPSEKFEVNGNIGLVGDIVFSNYADATDSIEQFLLIDENGRTQPKSKSGLIQFISDKDCYTYTNGVQTPAPTWASKPGTSIGSPGVLYTGATCPARVGIGTENPLQQLHVTQRAVFGQRVGIGNTDPQARLHIRTNLNNPAEKLFLIERQIGSNDPFPIFQVTNDGLVRSREVKVDLETWPDYVFAKEYDLMPLKDVKTFIEQNGHLPNVPAASEIETDGLNLGETAKITMEKVEELTLYLIQQQEQLDEQKMLIEEQRKLIEAQQRALEEMKQKTNQ